ncbi:uncharacterized protein CANTADRAFT_26855 [Suhomyces tanzawaensis NRRL Y-17324]|uniref:CTLH domain-containing protein n=1 Tax=Suhomyces tanzawaensis NRRL Y-17324 TaxID=984487 RepID=A0A1E4SE65_9ASCO|nr:uncharacterized protein CANTADRAFT_26855 [Suhomyces tanzawaensis NRRL Y-17324]ODV77814.1 hypothetical protein CANTADRAFT_26855 [Suhomyces tanzawaensis NRRL Y-17324]
MLSKEKIDHLILNYFIQEGYQEAAISFAKEIEVDLFQESPVINRLNLVGFDKIGSLDEDFSSMVEDYFDGDLLGTNRKSNVHENSKLVAGYPTIKERKEIKLLILKGEITEAIKKISDNFPTILDSNNLLHFKLLRLNLIEMIRNHKLHNVSGLDEERKFLDEILTFVRENLINKVSNSFKLLKELEITMSLLCFNFDPTIKNIEEQKDLPEQLRSLFSLSLRNQCYRLVNKEILHLYERDTGTDNDQLYRGPKFIEFDLNKFADGDNLTDNDDTEMKEEVDYEYNKSNDKSINQLISTSNDSEENSTKDESLEEELNKLQSLSLESKLERVIKLWTITEQRLVDLNLIKEKRYLMNKNSL